LSDRNFFHLFELATAGRVLGPLLHAAETGAVILSESQMVSVARQHRSAMAVAATLEARCPEVQATLRAAGADSLAVKGLATAYQLYEHTHHRQFGDVDLLVQPRRLEEITATLEAEGVEVDYPAIGPHIGQVQKSITALHGSGFEIDIHQTIAWGPQWLEITKLFFADAETIPMGIGPVSIPCATDLLFHSAVSLAQGQPRLASLFDFALAAQSARFDADRLTHLATLSHASGALNNALRYARAWFPDFDGQLPAAALASSGPFDVRSKISSLTLARKHLGMFMAVNALPLADRPRAVGELIVPAPGWRESRGRRSAVEHLRKLPKYVRDGSRTTPKW